MAFYSQKTDQYRYFAAQLNDDDWSGKDVLDFGGNIGNMLLDPDCTIEATRYWCIDVDPDAVEMGRSIHPDAHWRHYDRHCYFFNPGGKADLALPDLERDFDYITAYSVFTNTLRRDMLDLVAQLRPRLKPGGRLAFTFIDPHYRAWPADYPGDNLRWRLERDNREEARCDTADVLEKARGARWCLLVDGAALYRETDEVDAPPSGCQASCHAFYTADYLQTLFPDSIVKPPAASEMQHCCILGPGPGQQG